MTTTPYVLFIVRHCIIASLHHCITALYCSSSLKDGVERTPRWTQGWHLGWRYGLGKDHSDDCADAPQCTKRRERAHSRCSPYARGCASTFFSHVCVFYNVFLIRLYIPREVDLYIYTNCIYIMTISAHCVFALRSHHWWGSPPPPPLGEQLISDVSECCILLMCAEMRNLSTYDNVPLPFQQVSMLEQWQDEIKKHSRMDLSVRV